VLAAALGAQRAAFAVEGFGVAHAHVHLVPVNGAGEMDACRQRRASAEELRDVATRIRAALGTRGLVTGASAGPPTDSIRTRGGRDDR
jgi:hypothetical protein